MDALSCTDYRNNILAENAAFQYLIAEIETIMSEECEEYKTKKLQGWPKKMEESETDAENWERFIGVAREGKVAIRNCIHPLRKVSAIWGKEKLQHYGWAHSGQRYCKVLSTASSQVPDWEEAIIKLNQLMLRRMQMGGRRKFRRSVNPIDQIDLENLKKWTHKNPYEKNRDHENVLLQYGKLTINDLPKDCGFNKYGQIAHREFAVTIKARARTIPPKDGQDTSPFAVCFLHITTPIMLRAGSANQSIAYIR